MKARWSDEDLVLLARAEIELRDVVPSINDALALRFSSRSKEAIKGQRNKSARYRAILERLESEGNGQEQSSADVSPEVGDFRDCWEKCVDCKITVPIHIIKRDLPNGTVQKQTTGFFDATTPSAFETIEEPRVQKYPGQTMSEEEVDKDGEQVHKVVEEEVKDIEEMERNGVDEAEGVEQLDNDGEESSELVSSDIEIQIQPAQDEILNISDADDAIYTLL